MERPAPSLKAAIRKARIEDAERSEVVAELRGAEIARLEMLQAAIEPVLAQAPDEIDLFDLGLAPGERPRLFIDMVGFVEMGRDRRQYRFIQNMRHGRILIAESENLDTMRDAVTAYIARRLVEREKALAADSHFIEYNASAIRTPAVADERGPAANSAAAAPERKRGFVRSALSALIEILGSLALLLLLAILVWFALRLGWDWWTSAL